MKTLLVTGSSGLIGSEMCTYFAARGWKIHGLDNNQRATFFGPQGNTRRNQAPIQSSNTYYSELITMTAHYPGWDITIGLEETIRQIATSLGSRAA